MKEIKVSEHSKLPHIVGEQITIARAEELCASGFIRSLILTIVDNHWYQLICLSDEKKVMVYEENTTSYKFCRVWENRTLEEFVHEILLNYPNTEFYLIEGMQDLFKIIKERIPRWLPNEYQNV